MKSFTITSSRIRLRPHKEGDEILLNQAVCASFDILHKWMYWATAPQTAQQTKAFIDHCIECWSKARPKELPLLILDPGEEKLLGTISFNNIDWSVPAFEIGYWANVDHAGQGFISEAVNILTQYAFSKLNAKRVEIRCDPDNVKSAAIPQKYGFVLEGQLKNTRIQRLTKKVSDTLIYARYDDDDLVKIEYSDV